MCARERNVACEGVCGRVIKCLCEIGCVSVWEHVIKKKACTFINLCMNVCGREGM